MSSTKMLNAKITVKGLVQGVCFRAYTQDQAIFLGLTGYVKNQSDGTVFIEVEGSQQKIYQLLDWLREEGSPASEVSNVEVEWSNELKQFTNFRIAFY